MQPAYRYRQVRRACSSTRTTIGIAIISATLLILAPATRAQAEQPTPRKAVLVSRDSSETTKLRRELGALRARVEDLERKLSAQAPALGEAKSLVAPGETPLQRFPPKTAEQLELERKLAQELGSGPSQPSTLPSEQASAGATVTPVTSVGGGKQYANLSFDGLFAGGASTAEDVPQLETGGHDPVQRGFTVQNVEMVVEGAVDPYFRGQGNMVYQIDKMGGTTVELEEAYLTSTALSHDLQMKAGMYFTEFGRLNAQHPHTWDFADQPLVSGRFLGPDGLRGPGARLSWLAPTSFYTEAFLSIQNSQGGTAASFRDVPGEVVFGRPIQERPVRSTGDLLFVPRIASSFDLSETQTLLLGATAAFGPNGAGSRTRTRLLGGDLFWKWKPNDAEGGFPFVKWQSEAMSRRYEVDAFAPDSGTTGVGGLILPAAAIVDWGFYSQVLWGFQRGWVAGLRADYLRGANSKPYVSDPMGVERWRLSPNLTWYPTEFSKVRLQFNHDHVGTSRSEESLWLQVEFLIGSHGAHKF